MWHLQIKGKKLHVQNDAEVGVCILAVDYQWGCSCNQRVASFLGLGCTVIPGIVFRWKISLVIMGLRCPWMFQPSAPETPVRRPVGVEEFICLIGFGGGIILVVVYWAVILVVLPLTVLVLFGSVLVVVVVG